VTGPDNATAAAAQRAAFSDKFILRYSPERHKTGGFSRRPILLSNLV